MTAIRLALCNYTSRCYNYCMTIVGLGNPGQEYELTRHNVGRLALAALAQRLGGPGFEAKSQLRAKIARVAGSRGTGNPVDSSKIKILSSNPGNDGDLFLVEPLTFMNESGRAVRAVLDYFKLSTNSLYVLHDDLDLTLGSYKIQFGVGPKIHNGLLSLYEVLGTDQFWHVRLGVDGRNGDRSMPGQAYVLQKFSEPEMPIIEKMIAEVTDQLLGLLKSSA